MLTIWKSNQLEVIGYPDKKLSVRSITGIDNYMELKYLVVKRVIFGNENLSIVYISTQLNDSFST